MAKQLNVNLAFGADISQAKAAITNLQQSLMQLANMEVGDNLQLKEASAAAKELTYHLNQAYNAATGNIDLSALNNSLNKSQTNVTELSNRLLQAGVQGQQAFINLATAISKADYPMVKLNSRLNEMWTTLKNTARWQLSSSVLHGFMGAMQHANRYAQDLDESLNNIRIVTGYNTEQMASFAEEANKAAKVLSTTTTEYTNASLIYYQQGLSDQEVADRTAITIKMANAAGVSAQTVSDQLTAVWNNFAKVGDNLEYYADVMTALGAATASSTDEISEGLNKFAAVADTVGLSYEYATAALATVTAETRESADVVGTAYKTLFARIQGLTLGETLDDGTDLNKYSAALEKVGIDIKDTNGDMRAMDQILSELGAKWQTLGKDQQIALAQTVAGVRQYTHLIALMDNWDSFQENLAIAYDASGALQEQADIYAESWEAAQQRVEAAAEGVYDSIIDEKLFIKLNKIFADLLGGIESTIDGIGGFGGMLTSIGSFILILISDKITPALATLKQNIMVLFKSAQQQAQELINQVSINNAIALADTDLNKSQQQQLRNATSLSEARTKLSIASKDLTDQERLMYEFDIQFIQTRADQAQAIADKITALEKEKNALINNADAAKSNTEINKQYQKSLQDLEVTRDTVKADMDAAFDADEVDMATIDQQIERYMEARNAVQSFKDTKLEVDETINSTVQSISHYYDGLIQGTQNQQEFNQSVFSGADVFSAYITQMEGLGKSFEKTSQDAAEVGKSLSDVEVQGFIDKLKLIETALPNKAKTKEVTKAFEEAFRADNAEEFNAAIGKINQSLKALQYSGLDVNKIFAQLDPETYARFNQYIKQINDEIRKLTELQAALNNLVTQFNPTHLISGVERLTSLAGVLGQISMMASSISNIYNALFGDTDMSGGERLFAVLSGLAMLIPGVIGSVKGLNQLLQGTQLQMTLVSAATKKMTKDKNEAAVITALLTKQTKTETAAKAAEAVVMKILTTALDEEIKAKIAGKEADVAAALASLMLKKATAEETMSTLINTLHIDKDTAAKLANIVATKGLKASISSLLGPILAIVAVVTLVVAAYKSWLKHQQELREYSKKTHKEQAEEALKEAEAYKTAREEFEALLKVYQEAIANSDSTAKAQQAIADATWDLCEALGIEVDLIDKLQNKYQGYDTQAFAAQAAKDLEYIQSIPKKEKNLNEVLFDTFEDVVGTENKLNQKPMISQSQAWIYDGVYIPGSIGTNGSASIYNDGAYKKPPEGLVYAPNYGYATSDSGDTEVRDWIAKYSHEGVLLTGDVMGELVLDKNLSAKEQYEIIDDLVNYLKENVDDDLRRESEIYKWYESLVNSGKDAYKDFENFDTENAIKGYALNQAQSEIDFSKAQTYEDYSAIAEKVKNYLSIGYAEAGIEITDKELNELVEKYLQNIPNLSQIMGIEDVAEKTGIAFDELKKLYNDYDSSVFWSVNFDEVKSKEHLETQLKSLQALADASAIETKIVTTQSAADSLDKNMSLSDYEAFKEKSGIIWGEYDEDLKQNIITYNQFVSMTYEEQLKYLNDLTEQYRQAQLTNLDATLDSQKILLSEYQTEYENLNKKISEMRNSQLTQTARNLEKNIADTKAKLEELDSNKFAFWLPDTMKTRMELTSLLEQYQEEYDKFLQDHDESEFITQEDLERAGELGALIGDLETSIPEIGAQINILVKDTLSQATTIAELQEKMQTLMDAGIDIDYSIFAESLINLAEKYDNCTSEINDFELALASQNEELINSSAEALALSVAIGELAETYGLNAELIETQAEIYQDFYGTQKLSKKAAVEMAVQNQRLNKGVATLSSKWEDWNKIIKRNNRTSSEYAEVINDLKDVMRDLVGVSNDFEISTSFIEDHMTDIEKAAKGDEKAITDLGFELATATTKTWALDEAMLSLQAEMHGEDYAATLRENFTSNLSILQNGITSMQEAVANGSLQVGATWSSLSAYLGENWVTALNEMAIATGMTVSEMENLLASMNLDANVVVKNVNTTVQVPEYTTNVVPTGNVLDLIGGKGFSFKSTTVQTGVKPMDGMVQVPQISYGEDGKTPDVTYVGAGSVSPSAVTTTTGSDSDNKDSGSKLKATAKQDVVERYKEINDLIDDVADSYDEASKAADRMYGKDRIAKMQAMNTMLSNEIGLLEKKRKEAQDYLDIVDKPHLESVGAEYGLKFEFDKEGNISNYESQMSALYNELSGVEQSVKADGVTTEEQKLIDDVQDKIDAVEAAIKQYDETRELITDLDKDIQDTINQIQDANYEILEAKLDLDLAVQADELERIEYYLDKISDDFYHAAEGAAYLSDQIGLSKENIRDYKWFINSLAEEYNTIDPITKERKISQADYIEGLKDTRSAIYDELKTLNELDDEMINYYGDTLSSAQEELSTYTDRMEHLNSVLDHYQNLMEITGKSTNYENLTAVLQGQADLIKNSYNVSKANYEWLKSEADDLKVLMDEAQAAGNTAAYEGYRNEWLAAQAAAEEAQDEMLSQAAEWAEAMKTIVSTKLEELSKVLEESLTADFGSFDELSKNMERASSLQEEYLTTTNKIYETTKLMRTAQGVIDTTTNTVAKQRLKGFIEETAQLQNKNKLSQYELEIQQAKYDLLLAEIALEEAQNAKSTVTLRRDSEGNFGYVYTADQDQIADAEQKLEDAQNRLYNIGLEGANDYTQKYQETLSQMHDEISELTQAWLNGEIESEQEYHAKMQDIKDFYYEKLKDYSELYQVAISTDSAIVAEAWSTEFASMTNDTENWMTKVDEYVGDCSEVFQEWQGTIAEIEQMAGQDLDNLATGVSDITTESDKLVEAITKENGVLDTLAKQLDGTQLVTDAYIAQRDALQEVIGEMETYLRTVDGMIAAESGQANSLGTSLIGNNSSTTGNNSSSTGNNSTTDTTSNSNTTTSNTNTTSTTNQNNGDDTLINNSDKAEGVAAAIWLDGSSKSGWGKGDTRFARFKEKGVSEAQSIINNRSGELYNKYKNKKLSDYYYDAFDTGGYTGEWGSYGKLAMLHEKELILNQDDTANFLASIDILRNIVKVLDLQAAYSQLDNQLSSPGYYYPEEESVLEQNVHIEASFPNVENRSEIEEAFNNLINQASQYANRKR